MKFCHNDHNFSTGICVLALGLVVSPQSADAKVVSDLELSSTPIAVTATGAVKLESLTQNLHNLTPQELTIASNRRLHNLVSANEKPQLAPLLNLNNIGDQTPHDLTNLNFSPAVNVETLANSKPIPIPIESPESQPASLSIPVSPPSPSIPLPVTPPQTKISFEENNSNDQPVLITNPEDSNLFSNVATKQEITAETQNDQEQVASIPVPVDFYDPSNMPPAIEITSPDLPNQINSPEQYLPQAEKPFDGYIWPAKGTFTSGYGWRWGRMHRGIDVAGPVGTPIVAAADGEVITAGWNSGGFGNLVKIKHGDGSVTLYAHNHRLRVRRGQQVRQGQHIADMGSTGFSTGPHLHFEIHRDGKAKDPMIFLARG